MSPNRGEQKCGPPNNGDSIAMAHLHQIWFDLGSGSIPPHPTRRSAVRHMNPGLTYHLWSLPDARTLVARCYPQYVDLWNALPHGINRADFFRYILMHRFGGAYLDLDFVCCKPFDSLLLSVTDTVVVGEEWPFSFRDATVHNGALVSTSPSHPFWLHVMEEVRMRSVGGVDRGDIQESVFRLTGTAMLRDAVISYWGRREENRRFPVLVAPFFVFCPLSSRGALVTDYSDVPSKGSWNLPSKHDAHGMSSRPATFTFIAPAYKTWQKSFA